MSSTTWLRKARLLSRRGRTRSSSISISRSRVSSRATLATTRRVARPRSWARAFPAGGFTPGTDVGDDRVPGHARNRGQRDLRAPGRGHGSRTASRALSRRATGDGSGDVAGMPGLLSAAGEYVPRVSLGLAPPSTTSRSTRPPPRSIHQTSCSTPPATVSSRGRRTRCPARPSRSPSQHHQQATGRAWKPAARARSRSGGVANNVGSQAIGPAAGFFTGTAANRGIGLHRRPRRRSSPHRRASRTPPALRATIPRPVCRARSRQRCGPRASKGSTAT